jgi:hypothetical protein
MPSPVKYWNSQLETTAGWQPSPAALGWKARRVVTLYDYHAFGIGAVDLASFDIDAFIATTVPAALNLWVPSLTTPVVIMLNLERWDGTNMLEAKYIDFHVRTTARVKALRPAALVCKWGWPFFGHHGLTNGDKANNDLSASILSGLAFACPNLYAQELLSYDPTLPTPTTTVAPATARAQVVAMVGECRRVMPNMPVMGQICAQHGYFYDGGSSYPYLSPGQFNFQLESIVRAGCEYIGFWGHGDASAMAKIDKFRTNVVEAAA